MPYDQNIDPRLRFKELNCVDRCPALRDFTGRRRKQCSEHSCPCTGAIDLQPQDHPRLFRQVTRLLDDNHATARPAFREIAQDRLVAFACHEETAGQYDWWRGDARPSARGDRSTDSHLEVPNRDIGFVEEGQEAEIKIDTFSFTRYGLLHGEVLSVSQDAIARDKPQDKTTDKSQGTDQASSEPRGQELVYAARISLDRTRMQIENKLANLSPGMAVTVEIKTGSRPIISYLLSPLLRYGQESLRER